MVDVMSRPGEIAENAYARGRRFVLCGNCGATVEVAVEGGRLACGYCSAPIVVRVRADAGQSQAGPPLDEQARIARLASQDPGFRPPPAIEHLFAGPRVAQVREAEARRIWRDLTGSLGSVARFEPADQLFFLTMGLAELDLERGNATAQRAVIESALEVLSIHRHRQILTAQLSRSASRAGDLASAEQWLGACNPASHDLHADTAYRLARACIDTARGDFRAVVNVLETGSRGPLSNAYEAECAVLRANAWERMGQKAIAVDVLTKLLHERGPIARERARHFIARHASWQLCRASEPEARRVASTLVPELPYDRNIVLKIVGSMALVCVLWMAGGAIGALASLLMDLGWGYIGFGMSFLTGCTLSPLLGWVTIRVAMRVRARNRHIRHGIAHSAFVLASASRPHGMFGPEGVLEVDLDLLVTPVDAPAYRARATASALQETLARFAPGASLVARATARDPKDLLVDVE